MFNPEGQWRTVDEDGEELACVFQWQNLNGQEVELRVNSEWDYPIELRGSAFIAWLTTQNPDLAFELVGDGAAIAFDVDEIEGFGDKFAQYLLENPMGYYPPDPQLLESQRLCGEFQDELQKLLPDGEPAGWEISAGDTDVNLWSGALDLSVQFDAGDDLPLRVIGCEIVPGHKDHGAEDADAWDGTPCHKDLPASELQNVANIVASFLIASAQKAEEIDLPEATEAAPTAGPVDNDCV